jgi:predicted nucleic acid-binding protein
VDVRRLLDTNAVLYLLGGRLSNPLEPAVNYLSIISEMELLSYPAISPEEEAEITRFISRVTVIGLSREIRDQAIRLRRAHRLRLPDAIIAATAFVLDAELFTNDAALLRVSEVASRKLEIING